MSERTDRRTKGEKTSPWDLRRQRIVMFEACFILLRQNKKIIIRNGPENDGLSHRMGRNVASRQALYDPSTRYIFTVVFIGNISLCSFMNKHPPSDTRENSFIHIKQYLQPDDVTPFHVTSSQQIIVFTDTRELLQKTESRPFILCLYLKRTKRVRRTGLSQLRHIILQQPSLAK